MNLRICLFSLVALILHILNAYANDRLSDLDDLQIPESSINAQAFESQPLEINDLEAVVSRGLEFLFMGQLENALDDFNYVLNNLHDGHKSNKTIFGTALWGRLLCHAYANQDEEAFNDLSTIRSYFIDNACYHCRQLFNSSSLASANFDYKIFQIADFANPGERITSSECKNRVVGTANIMRVLAMKIRSRALADAVNFTINQLEYAACQCCDRSHWTECLTPIIDSWNYLKKCMDKGAAIAPNLAGPGR